MPSPLSFHCMICFEEFDVHTRYPVVLPCGHTYICVVCASKIDKCMECRKSLFTVEKEAITQPHQIGYASSYDRRRPRSYTSTVSGARVAARRLSPPPQNKEKKEVKRLPLPKNVVLLSLIESSQLEPSISSDPSMPHYSDDTEEERIVMSTDLATSSCGTYAVAKKEGLDIVPTMDHRSMNPNPFGETDESKPRSLIGRMRSNPPIVTSTKASSIHLNYGDRVQVVTIVNNCAKLARGYGYVYFGDSSDLVKVAGVLDKACTIESMLYMLSYRRNDLVEQKATIEKDAIHLMHELQHTMHVEEDLTVIGAEAFSSEDIVPEVDVRDDQLLIESASNDKLPPRSTDENSTSSNDVPTFTDWLFGGLYSSTQNSETRQEPNPCREMLTNNAKVSRAMLDSAESWRKRNGREAATLVDFRTGLSGHLGALGHHAQHDRQKVETISFKMSSHGGLTPNRRGSRDSSGSRRHYR